MSRALPLYRLERLDDEEEQARRRLAEIAAVLGETPALRQARQALRQAADRLQRCGVRQRDLELEVRGLKDEIAASERTLYGGAIRNPKELSDLQAKVASLQRFHARKEEDLLEAMIAAEEAEAAHAQAQARLTEVEAAWAADQGDLRAEAGRLESRLAEIARQRESLLPNIPAGDLETYRALRRKKGQAVAVMRGDSCTACGMEMPPGPLARGREAGLIVCDNCGRLLLPEAELGESPPRS